MKIVNLNPLDAPVGNAGLYFRCFNIQEFRPLPKQRIFDFQKEKHLQ